MFHSINCQSKISCFLSHLIKSLTTIWNFKLTTNLLGFLKIHCKAAGQSKHCVCSLFPHCCAWMLTVNCTSPVRLHLLTRVRAWLAESSSSARRGQSSWGRLQISVNGLDMEGSMDASLSLFLLKPFSLFISLFFIFLFIPRTHVCL